MARRNSAVRQNPNESQIKGNYRVKGPKGKTTWLYNRDGKHPRVKTTEDTNGASS